MQSSLKKSLYLGLAALTFASVAGASVSATSTNANAAKHTTKKVAKKVTYKVTSVKDDNVYLSTGSAAIYSKPGKVSAAKKTVVTKAKMKSISSNPTVADQFTVTGTATTSNGLNYYRVESFNHKIKGYVYNAGIAKSNAYTDTSSSYNFGAAGKAGDGFVYLKTVRLFDQPYGVRGAKLQAVSSSFNAASTKFRIDQAVVNNQGQTYFHVQAYASDATSTSQPLTNNLIGSANQGWVNKDNLAGSSADAFTNNKITIKFVDAKTKAVVDTQEVNLNNVVDSSNNSHAFDYDATLNSTTPNVFQQSTISTIAGYVLGTDTKLAGYSLPTENAKDNNNKPTNVYYNALNFSGVTKGSVVTALVNHDDSTTTVKPTFVAVDKNGNVISTVDLSTNTYLDSKTPLSTFPVDLKAAGLTGYTTANFSLSNVIANLFADGKQFNTILVKNGSSFDTYKFNADVTKTLQDSSVYNQFTGDQTVTYASAASVANDTTKGIKFAFTKVDSAQTKAPIVPSKAATTGTTTTYNVYGKSTNN